VKTRKALSFDSVNYQQLAKYKTTSEKVPSTDSHTLLLLSFIDSNPDRPSSTLLAPSVPSNDKAPETKTTGSTSFNNPKIGHHSDSDADSNLEFSFQQQLDLQLLDSP